MPAKTPLNSKYSIDVSTGCWNLKKPSKTGYSSVRHNGVMQPAHRAVYAVTRGPIPEGLELDHLCRNPKCVNPDHLEPVTQIENVRRGSATKLNVEVVAKIREQYSSGLTLSALSRVYGICIGHLSAIVNGDSWSDVGGPIAGKCGNNRPRHGRRRLTDDQAVDIRNRYMNGEDKKLLAEQFGVHKCTIDQVVSGRKRFSFLNGQEHNNEHC